MRVDRVLGIMPNVITEGEAAKKHWSERIVEINKEADAKLENLKAKYENTCNIEPTTKEMAALKLACDSGKAFDEWSQKSSIERFRKVDL